MALKPRFCDMNYNKKNKKEFKFYEDVNTDVNNDPNLSGGKIKPDNKNDDNKNDDNKNDDNKKRNKENDDDDDDDDDEDEDDNDKRGNEDKKEKENSKDSNKDSDNKDSNKDSNKDNDSDNDSDKDKNNFIKKEIDDNDEIPLTENNSEIGIPELIKLYYDVYDEEKKEFTSMSELMKKKYQEDVEQFYTTFTGKQISRDENDQPTITRFDQIPLREFHKNDKCKPDGMLRQNVEGSMNDNLFKKYAMHINKMINKMNNNQNSLLKVLKEIFIFKDERTNS